MQNVVSWIFIAVIFMLAIIFYYVSYFAFLALLLCGLTLGALLLLLS